MFFRLQLPCFRFPRSNYPRGGAPTVCFDPPEWLNFNASSAVSYSDKRKNTARLPPYICTRDLRWDENVN